MKRTSFKTMPCPLARAMEYLSDSWNALILREAFYGAARFDDFESALGIATNTLASRLKDLVTGGLFERRQYSITPPRYEYVLTEKGRDLRPVMLALLHWGNKHEPSPNSTARLMDSQTGLAVDLALIDAVTGERIGPRHKVMRRAPDGTSLQSYPFPDAVRH